MMNYMQIEFETKNTEQAEQLIALLSELDFEGFEEEGLFLKAFIPEDLFDTTTFEEVVQRTGSIAYNKSIIENINWNKQWEENFEPVVVNDFVVVRAHFHASIPSVKHEIIITPKMSFGTGHHATTYMMMQTMEEIDFKGNTVLDFGTGTGVLAILAEKLGASACIAIDNDEWSITNTNENIQQNNCSTITVSLQSEIQQDRKYDVILANINLNVILAAMYDINFAAKKGAKILLSGFLTDNEIDIKNSLTKNGLTYLSSLKRGEWIAILAIK